ncbi:MAG: LTA synthase family protein, partial [Nitrospinaceae bacterium]
SAEYLGAFGNTFNLTPNLDALAGKSLLFTRFYATGNRTVRGLEAINLSLPPTPGYSVVKRPNNEHLFSLGELFKSQGYLLKFIYGGFGYFDNMNYFFENNGFTSIDRSDFAGNEIDFANIWGVSDASLLAKALQEADLSYATGQPFFNYVLTTSNHRPYTYPDGKIDIPSGTGRWGGVKYTDFAIGQFLEKARRKPWFDDTLFVIVADHCAGGRGRTDLPINNYHIPMLIYAPKLIPPGIMDTLSSQVDVAPTLAGMLGFSYASKFLGKDILRMKKSEGRAFIATYQNLGYYVDGRLVHLAPKEKSEVFQVDDRNHSHLLPTSAPRALQPAISYYQFASILLDHHLYGFPVNF